MDSRKTRVYTILRLCEGSRSQESFMEEMDDLLRILKDQFRNYTTKQVTILSQYKHFLGRNFYDGCGH